MIFVKTMLGSTIGAIIGIHVVRWLGWLPTYDAEAERFFLEHWKEIVHGVFAVGMALAALYCLFLMLYALYRLARTID